MLTFDGAGDFEPGNYGGRNFHFGIREHGMAAAVERHGADRSCGRSGDVLRLHRLPASRRCDWRDHGKLPVILIFTHDSIGVGEDGPTHQPIEHLAAMRAIPNLLVIRPGRRQRSGRGLARGDAAHRSAGGAGAHAAEPADARPHEVCRRQPAWPRGRMCWPMPRGASRR